MVAALTKAFPQGAFNCWGVPEGAQPVVRQLSVGDAVLLMRTIAGDGEIPALAVVQAFWRQPMRDLSRALWGSDRFPYVFFFETVRIDLSWSQLKRDVQFNTNYRAPAHFLRVANADDRLIAFGGVRGYLRHLRGSTGGRSPRGRVSEPTPEVEYIEGQRLLGERQYFVRNPQLVRAAKEHYGCRCQACGFDFRARYGDLGDGFIECHHLDPLSEREDGETVVGTSLQDVAVLCSNCHRMIHRRRPALSLDELRAALRSAAA